MRQQHDIVPAQQPGVHPRLVLEHVEPRPRDLPRLERCHQGGLVDDDALLQWANARLGKTQRLLSLRSIDELPRSPIGKVLKRELRESYGPVQKSA